MPVPTLTTQATTSITQTRVTGNATILTGSPITRRGFQFNTREEAPPDGINITYETGDFTTGDYDLEVGGFIPNTRYYMRAFAENADGIGYGGWTTFVTLPQTYNVEIDGVDRTGDVINQSLRIDDIINDQVNTCRFAFDDLSGGGIPDNDEEIIITMDDGSKLFAGYVVNVSYGSKPDGGGEPIATIECVDYTRKLDSNLVHKTYENMTDKAIIEDIVATYCAGFGITTANVLEGVTIEQISFNYLQPSQCIRKLAELSGRHWYIDYDKDIHYFPLTTNTAPFDIDDNTGYYWGLKVDKDASQIKNRVYVRGGTKLSEFTQYIEVGDGEKRQFVLPDKPHDVTVYVDRGVGYVEESVGIKNIDTEGYKWYLNFQEKYLDQDSGETVLGNTDKLKVIYKYDIPILVAVENTQSIIDNGQREFAIFDKSIATTQAARDRASAELTDYANRLIEGSFKTYEVGFISGQYININLTDYGINDDYIVQKVTAIGKGAGTYLYEVSVASAKTLGIIKFLIKLLEANKNLIELDDNEVIDELLQLSDSLLSDSLIDSLTIDSTGPYFVYQSDSAPVSDLGIGRWGLAQYRY